MALDELRRQAHRLAAMANRSLQQTLNAAQVAKVVVNLGI